MDDLLSIVSSAFEAGQAIIDGNDKRFSNVESKLQSYLERAKETLVQKQIAIPKPAKRPMRTIQDEDEEDEIETELTKAAVQEQRSSQLRISTDKILRPVRTAKVKANKNLKEAPINTKMRNDNNTVVKMERVSSMGSSRESIKENKEPEIEVNGSKSQKRKSPDEGIQSATESDADAGSERNARSKRSDSVELITAKTVEIDITSGDDFDKMPPPAVPKKATKKTRTKQKKPVEEVEPENPQPGALRVTRSKIKQEKVSIDRTPSQLPEVETTLQSTSDIDTTKSNETAVTKKVSKKKYPMPILVKIENPEEIAKKLSESPAESPPVLESPPVEFCNDTFNVPTVNETVTLGPAPTMNETVTIAPNPNATITIERNPNESLMTEDNDDDEASEEVPLSLLKKQKQPLPTMPALKLKKNEVFNPYLSSPVKQKVQAFEKHAVQGIATPEKYKPHSSKYSTLKAGTPSKIALYSKTTTPLSISKSQRFITTSASGPIMPSSAPGGPKPSKPLKKTHSMSQESLEETKKLLQNNAMNQLLEEKRKLREEKQRQAQSQREALEKEKRDQAMKLQMERDEKYRKIMKEKEDKQRMEQLKKKMLKEKQAKKYAEERAKKDEFLAPKPVESFVNKDDSLHLKLQKQIIQEKAEKQKKEESKSIYNFEMLHTDDSTDDEARPSQKRPAAPSWSKKSHRKPVIASQSYTNESVLDSVFSVQPISVDLRAIFPAIDTRKLIRNSSAIWRTPPKQYQHSNF